MFKDVDKIATGFLGLPFIPGGRSLEGVDCFGLAILVARQCGVELPDYLPSPDDLTESRTVLATEYHQLIEQVDNENQADLVSFEKESGSLHLGIVLPRRRFLHTTTNSGTLISKLHEQPWCRRKPAFYLVKRSAI